MTRSAFRTWTQRRITGVAAWPDQTRFRLRRRRSPVASGDRTRTTSVRRRRRTTNRERPVIEIKHGTRWWVDLRSGAPRRPRFVPGVRTAMHLPSVIATVGWDRHCQADPWPRNCCVRANPMCGGRPLLTERGTRAQFSLPATAVIDRCCGERGVHTSCRLRSANASCDVRLSSGSRGGVARLAGPRAHPSRGVLSADASLSAFAAPTSIRATARRSRLWSTR